MAGFLDRLFNVNARELKAIGNKVEKVERYADEMAALSDEQLQAKTPYFRELLANGSTLDDILPEAFATVREAAKRVIGEYPFHVQLMGGVVLHQGDIAEMKTGEGKTLTWQARVFMSSPSTNTWLNVTPSGWARSTSS